MYIAIVSTVVETSTPELELEPGFKLLGPIEQKCVHTQANTREFVTEWFSLSSGLSLCRPSTRLPTLDLAIMSLSPSHTMQHHTSSTHQNSLMLVLTELTVLLLLTRTVTEDVHDVWRRVTGTELQLKKRDPEALEGEERHYYGPA